MVKQNRISVIKSSLEDFPTYAILVNDEILENVLVGERFHKSTRPNLYVICNNIETSKIISLFTFEELIDVSIGSIFLQDWIKWEDIIISVQLKTGLDHLENNFIEVETNPDLPNWKANYSYNEYRQLFAKLWKHEKDQGILLANQKDVAFKTVILASLNGSPIYKEIDDNLKLNLRIHKLVNEKLTENELQNVFITSFNFPEQVKLSCEQYLLYFAQFLKDLGINATSNLKEETGKVLFSVTPSDDKQALDKIREALAIYLKLPASPIVYDQSLAARRMQQQIENLQHSQKMAAREFQLAEKVLVEQSNAIQEKNIVISQKDSTIEQQSKIIEKITSKSIMMDSLENKPRLEEICEGLEIGESEF